MFWKETTCCALFLSLVGPELVNQRSALLIYICRRAATNALVAPAGKPRSPLWEGSLRLSAGTGNDPTRELNAALPCRGRK